MTSIITNNASMAALQTLRSIGGSLDQAQLQVSTGLRVDKASDNAAYWSIATSMRSDKGVMEAVSDSMASRRFPHDGLRLAVTEYRKDRLGRRHIEMRSVAAVRAYGIYSPRKAGTGLQSTPRSDCRRNSGHRVQRGSWASP